EQRGEVVVIAEQVGLQSDGRQRGHIARWTERPKLADGEWDRGQRERCGPDRGRGEHIRRQHPRLDETRKSRRTTDGFLVDAPAEQDVARARDRRSELPVL